MKIAVEPGTIVRIGPRTLSTKGGEFEIPELRPAERERILAIEGVRSIDDEYPRIEKRKYGGWRDVYVAPGKRANEKALTADEAEELLLELEG